MKATADRTVAMTQGIYTHAEPIKMQRRIGSTVYKINVYFSPEARETIDEKILRLIKNDLNLPSIHGKMDLSQTSRLPERSSA